MDAGELRALQAPLKQRYRESADSARIPARAVGVLDGPELSCRVQARHGGEMVAGLHPAAGGAGELACSADMLLEALVACAGVTLRAVATSMGLAVRGGQIVAEGFWDARGTLGVDKAVPVGITEIALRFELDTDADAAQVERLIATTERFCVIFQTLRAPPRLSITHEIVGRANP